MVITSMYPNYGENAKIQYSNSARAYHKLMVRFFKDKSLLPPPHSQNR